MPRCVVIILALVLASISCGQSAVNYLQEKDINSEISQIMKPLGNLDQHEMELIDELAELPAETRSSETVLHLLRSITQDSVITEEELQSFMDIDRDGLINTEEVKAGSDMLNPDTDDDGLTDGEEILNHESSPVREDTDEDGLSDNEEVLSYKTNPTDADSDGDGFFDSDEVLVLKMNPLDPEFDYDMNTTIKTFSQLELIINRIADDLGVRQILDKIYISVSPRESFNNNWQQIMGRPPQPDDQYLHFTGSIKSDPSIEGIIMAVENQEAYRLIPQIFRYVGDLDHMISYSKHYNSSNEPMKSSPGYLLQGAAIRRLSELGDKTYQCGATQRNIQQVDSMIDWMKAHPTVTGVQSLLLVWTALTEDNDLSDLFDEFKEHNALSSASLMDVYHHMLEKDNAYPNNMHMKMLDRTDQDSYIEELYEIWLSKLGDKPDDESDPVILTTFAFYMP